MEGMLRIKYAQQLILIQRPHASKGIFSKSEKISLIRQTL